jgi:hypothetical protein
MNIKNIIQQYFYKDMYLIILAMCMIKLLPNMIDQIRLKLFISTTIM